MGEQSVAAHRRIHNQPQMLVVDMTTNRVLRPSKAAFEPDVDGLSVYVHDRLMQLGLGPADVRVVDTQVVAGLSAETIMEQDLKLVADPETSGPQPVGEAHGLIVGWDSLPSSKARVRCARALANAAVCTFPRGDWADLPPPA